MIKMLGKIKTKMTGFGTASVALCGLLFASTASAELSSKLFSSIKDVNAFCGQEDLRCYSISYNGFLYTVQYEVVNGTNNGPNHGDGGDGDGGGGG